MVVASEADVCGELAAANLAETRVLNGPSKALASVGDCVANENQSCDGRVGVAPPNIQSSNAFCPYEVRGIRQA